MSTRATRNTIFKYQCNSLLSASGNSLASSGCDPLMVQLVCPQMVSYRFLPCMLRNRLPRYRCCSVAHYGGSGSIQFSYASRCSSKIMITLVNNKYLTYSSELHQGQTVIISKVCLVVQFRNIIKAYVADIISFHILHQEITSCHSRNIYTEYSPFTATSASNFQVIQLSL